jgi:glycosyltransferase involved in cell wall biosynthesis
MRKTKILHVIRSLSPEHGGPMEGIRRLAQIASQQSYEIAVVSLDPPDAPFLSALQFPVFPLGPCLGKYGYTRRLRKWLKEHIGQYDGVVINGLWQYHGVGTWSVVRGKCPYVVFTHGMLDPYFKRRYPLKHIKKWLYWTAFEYWMLKQAHAVLFTSPLERDLAEQSFALHKWNGAVVPYGTTGPEVGKEDALDEFYKRFPELRGGRFLLYLSRIHPKKGCDLLVEAFAKVAPHAPGLKLIMAGPDPTGWADALKDMASRLGVADRIIWPGMMSGALKWGAFYACEAYVLPSHQENFGIAVAEALACKKAVLTTDKVNIWPDLLADKCGLVEPDTLAGIEKLLLDWEALSCEERKAMGERAFATFTTRFNMRGTALGILQHLDTQYMGG